MTSQVNYHTASPPTTVDISDHDDRMHATLTAMHHSAQSLISSRGLKIYCDFVLSPMLFMTPR